MGFVASDLRLLRWPALRTLILQGNNLSANLFLGEGFLRGMVRFFA